jgi:hypothetical protein
LSKRCRRTAVQGSTSLTILAEIRQGETKTLYRSSPSFRQPITTVGEMRRAQPKERSFGQALSNGSSQSRQSQTVWFDFQRGRQIADE